MGSEMCIRDRRAAVAEPEHAHRVGHQVEAGVERSRVPAEEEVHEAVAVVGDRPVVEEVLRVAAERRRLGTSRGPLFLSESTRNRAAPMTKWTWSKVVRRLALRAGVPMLTTHSFRHLCLTDLARAGWDIQEIASFAGHRSIQSTLLYIHLSARDLSEKFARSMAAVHEDRLRQLRGGAT